MRRHSTLALLFVGYVVTAKIGLSLASVHPSATAIWPPTGIALAALLLLGRDVWPAVCAGAFLANVTTEGSIATSLGIAAGNTLEGIAGAYLVHRYAHGSRAFNHPRDIFRFVALAGLISPLVSATIGVTVLSLAGYALWSQYQLIWATWWLGGVSGAILVTPLFLVWASSPVVAWGRAEWLEAALLLLALIASAAAVFGGFYRPAQNYPLAFFCIPTIVWIAFRYGQRETAAAIVVVSAVAVWGTLRGSGPFGVAVSDAGLLLLQAFMCTVAVMAMSIAALVAEHRRLLAAERRARAEAEAANVAKDTFLAMLGHELRNPLAAIGTAVHVLDRVVALNDQAERIRDVINRQVAQLARLVDDLLDVTRVTAGKIVLNRKRIELGDLVKRCIETLSATGKTDRHHLIFEGETAWVDVDAARLEQVVANLITNALKYTPPGGTIRVIVAVERPWAILRVEDTGIGIAPEMLPRIFDLFTQGDRGSDRSQGGLGIGLTLVKRLVELHRGAVEAASEGLGRGSQFTVRLPATSPGRASDHVIRRAGPPRPFRVLLVEDQADAREVLRMALQLAGHEVFEAADGLAGIEAVAR
ncbi:MAG: MASE1 domain-containing protein, partial [Acidobacteria bacterium]|nr:MASE1 domain-containing protein [Acidobacteriota bacterium]